MKSPVTIIPLPAQPFAEREPTSLVFFKKSMQPGHGLPRRSAPAAAPRKLVRHTASAESIVGAGPSLPPLGAATATAALGGGGQLHRRRLVPATPFVEDLLRVGPSPDRANFAPELLNVGKFVAGSTAVLAERGLVPSAASAAAELLSDPLLVAGGRGDARSLMAAANGATVLFKPHHRRGSVVDPLAPLQKRASTGSMDAWLPTAQTTGPSRTLTALAFDAHRHRSASSGAVADAATTAHGLQSVGGRSHAHGADSLFDMVQSAGFVPSAGRRSSSAAPEPAKQTQPKCARSSLPAALPSLADPGVGAGSGGMSILRPTVRRLSQVYGGGEAFGAAAASVSEDSGGSDASIAHEGRAACVATDWDLIIAAALATAPALPAAPTAPPAEALSPRAAAAHKWLAAHPRRFEVRVFLCVHVLHSHNFPRCGLCEGVHPTVFPPPLVPRARSSTRRWWCSLSGARAWLAPRCGGPAACWSTGPHCASRLRTGGTGAAASHGACGTRLLGPRRSGCRLR